MNEQKYENTIVALAAVYDYQWDELRRVLCRDQTKFSMEACMDIAAELGFGFLECMLKKGYNVSLYTLRW